MGDDYIDYDETFEYGEHFLSESLSLVGASPLVDMAVLRGMVRNAMDNLGAAMDSAGVIRTSRRGARSNLQIANEALQTSIKKFYLFLQLHQGEAAFDLRSFFPDGNMGALARLKDADLRNKASEILRGFNAPANAALPEAEHWKQRLTGDRDTITEHLEGRASAHSSAIKASASMRKAREEFLTAYNGVAKKLTQGLLNALSRGNEYQLFFKDLQVNESSPAKKGEEQPA